MCSRNVGVWGISTAKNRESKIELGRKAGCVGRGRGKGKRCRPRRISRELILRPHRAKPCCSIGRAIQLNGNNARWCLAVRQWVLGVVGMMQELPRARPSRACCMCPCPTTGRALLESRDNAGCGMMRSATTGSQLVAGQARRHTTTTQQFAVCSTSPQRQSVSMGAGGKSQGTTEARMGEIARRS